MVGLKWESSVVEAGKRKMGCRSWSTACAIDPSDDRRYGFAMDEETPTCSVMKISEPVENYGNSSHESMAGISQIGELIVNLEKKYNLA